MNLKELRNDLGLTQQDLANTLKCSQANISMIENGKQNLRTIDLAKLIKVYDLSTDVIKELILNELKEKTEEN
jgi:transcriptional regulator with XRE-family HTH domain